MKKLLVIFTMLISVATFSAFGRGGGSSSLKRIIKILEIMQKTQTGMNLETIEIKLKEIEQIENQLKQLENDARNLKRLGEDIKNFNVDALLDAIDRGVTYRNAAEQKLLEDRTKLDNMAKYFSLNQSEFRQGSEWEQKKVKEVAIRIEKMRDKVKKNTLLLNAQVDAKNGDYYSSRAKDMEALKTMINQIEDADGALQATQQVSYMLGQTNRILIDIKDILREQTHLLTSTQAMSETEIDTQKERQKEEEEENERIQERLKEQAIKDSKKSLKLEFKKVK